MEIASKHILVLEDELDVREAVAEILILNKFKVTTSIDVKDALEKINDKKPDLIISDILMPGETGLDFIKEVRALPECLSIPFIFLTAQSADFHMREGMNLGADDYITKPFKSADLIKSVKLRLEKKSYFDDKIDLILDGIAKYVPHELRTPLVAILGYPQLIKDGYEHLEKDELFEMLDHINVGGRRILNTLEKFILFSDLESLKIKSNDKHSSISFNIEQVVLESFFQLNLEKDRTNDLVIKIEEAQLKIETMHLNIVIKQLLDNAIKFSKPGEIIKILGYKQQNHYYLKIEDSGKGMSNEELSKLNPFVQFNRNMNQQNGNGLGLAIVENILELYRYNYKIRSELNFGTTVTLRFELAD